MLSTAEILEADVLLAATAATSGLVSTTAILLLCLTLPFNIFSRAPTPSPTRSRPLLLVQKPLPLTLGLCLLLSSLLVNLSRQPFNSTVVSSTLLDGQFDAVLCLLEVSELEVGAGTAVVGFDVVGLDAEGLCGGVEDLREWWW